MRKILILSVLVGFSICSCAFNRSTNILIQGTNIKSPYGAGNGKIIYKATTRWSLWQK